jgi:hypothetical protein
MSEDDDQNEPSEASLKKRCRKSTSLEPFGPTASPRYVASSSRQSSPTASCGSTSAVKTRYSKHCDCSLFSSRTKTQSVDDLLDG